MLIIIVNVAAKATGNDQIYQQRKGYIYTNSFFTLNKMNLMHWVKLEAYFTVSEWEYYRYNGSTYAIIVSKEENGKERKMMSLLVLFIDTARIRSQNHKICIILLLRTKMIQ